MKEIHKTNREKIKRVWFSVDDLFTIRILAQAYLINKVYRYEKVAVYNARRALLKMKRRFN